MQDARMHPALLERLHELAGGIPLSEAVAATDARGPDDLPALIRYLIQRRRAEDAVPREIPVSNRPTPPDWAFRLAGEPLPGTGRKAAWPASMLESPLERETNPLMRLYLALAMRARVTVGVRPRGWPWFIHVTRLLLLALLVWLAAQGAGLGPAVLVALVAGGWMLLATPHVAERISVARAVAGFDDALLEALEDDPPRDESLSPPSAAP